MDNKLLDEIKKIKSLINKFDPKNYLDNEVINNENKKITQEIYRFRELSGLNLINEQGTLIDNLLSLSGRRIKNVDDIMKALELTGKELSDADIDKFCDELVGVGEITDDMVKKLRGELKANAKLRSALSNRSEDFVSAVKNAGKKENLVGLVGVNLLNKLQVMVIYTKLVKKFLDIVGSNTQAVFNSIDNEFASYLQQIYDSGIGIHNIDEVWDVLDGNILEHVNTSGFSPELAEAHYKEFTKRIREGSKTKEIIDKINADGRNAGKPKRTTPVTEYKPDYNIPKEWAGTPKKLIHRDEGGTPIKFEKKADKIVDGTKKFEIDMFFSKNSNKKKKFQNWIRKVLYKNQKLKVWNIGDLNLTEEVVNFLNDYRNSFLKDVGDGNYKSMLDENYEWDQLNMLDTNNKDGMVYLNDLLLRKKGTTNLTQEEFDNFLVELEGMTDDELKNELEYLKQNKNKFTETSSTTTRIGNATEDYFIGDILNLTEELSDKFELVYHAGSIKGNPIDTILGIDAILKNKNTNQLVPIQIKKTNSIYVKPSKLNPNQDSFSFWLTTPIKLEVSAGKEVYGVVVDNKGNFLMFGPQMQYKKVDDLWLKTQPGFNRRNNINYVDIDLDGNSDFITNIDF